MSTVPECPCGRDIPYEDCCGLYHAGNHAPDAEALMRSRYSAFVLGEAAYLLDTWHPDTRPAALELSKENSPKWLGLIILRHVPSGDSATVEFVARYKVNGRAFRQHELSRFVREEGQWYYVDGDQIGDD